MWPHHQRQPHLFVREREQRDNIGNRCLSIYWCHYLYCPLSVCLCVADHLDKDGPALSLSLSRLYSSSGIREREKREKRKERKGAYRLCWNQRGQKWAVLVETAAVMRSGRQLHRPLPPMLTRNASPCRKLDASVRIVVGYRPSPLPTRTPSILHPLHLLIIQSFLSCYLFFSIDIFFFYFYLYWQSFILFWLFFFLVFQWEFSVFDTTVIYHWKVDRLID